MGKPRAHTESSAAPCPFSSMSQWPAQVRHCAGRWLQEALQHRELVVHSGFTGLGSHARALHEMGIHFRDALAAEPKQAAIEWQISNDTMALMRFDDIRDMTEMCQSGGLADSTGGQPDLYYGGLPCQPYSGMRANHSSVPCQQHPEFLTAEMQVQYLLAVQPKAAILENTMGFGQQRSGARFPDGSPTPLQWMMRQLEGTYHITTVQLDLKAWVQLSRPRLWVLLVHHHCGTQAAADFAGEVALQLETARETHPPNQLEEILAPMGSVVFKGPAASRAQPRGREAEEQATKSWQRQAHAARRQLRELGYPDFNSHPLADATLEGLSPTPRIREVLEVRLLLVCYRLGLASSDPKQLAAAKKGLYADPSQNLRNPLKSAASHICPGICTSSTPYSYQLDRRLVAEEVASAFGWRSKERAPTLPATLSETQVLHLVANSQALPCLAVATCAILRALGPAIGFQPGPP